MRFKFLKKYYFAEPKTKHHYQGMDVFCLLVGEWGIHWFTDYGSWFFCFHLGKRNFAFSNLGFFKK